MASQNAKKKGTAAEPKYPLGLLLPIIAVLSVIPLICILMKPNLASLNGTQARLPQSTFSFTQNSYGFSLPVHA